MNENIITWNFSNWVTITIMAFVGYAILGFVVSFLKKRAGGSDD